MVYNHLEVNMKHTLSVNEVLERGVEQVLPLKQGLADLMKKKKITLYLGIDPTGMELHLGHSVVLRKLQQFADLGHHVILLIGNGTVKIGDPSGKDKTRPMLADTIIEENFKTWREQASKILDFSKIEVRRNGDWLDKLTFPEIVRLLSKFTVQQLIERDMFQERLKSSLPIYMHEILYPVMQGYDSVVMDVDLELGGNDQTFNMMVGRELMKSMKGKEKYVLATPLLVGSDGRKMGKSLHNYISLTATPEDMYGKLMRVIDEVMVQYFTLLTDTPAEEIAAMERQLKDGSVNPIEIKKKLAFTITAMYHSEKDAKLAQEHFKKTVQKKEVPEKTETLTVSSGKRTVQQLVESTNVSASNSEARRLIEQGGVSLNGKQITDPKETVTLKNGDVVKVGKRNFFTVKVGR